MTKTKDKALLFAGLGLLGMGVLGVGYVAYSDTTQIKQKTTEAFNAGASRFEHDGRNYKVVSEDLLNGQVKLTPIRIIGTDTENNSDILSPRRSGIRVIVPKKAPTP